MESPPQAECLPDDARWYSNSFAPPCHNIPWKSCKPLLQRLTEVAEAHTALRPPTLAQRSLRVGLGNLPWNHPVDQSPHQGLDPASES